MKRRGRAALPSLVFLSLAAYFLHEAARGERGLDAYARRHEDLANAQADLRRAQAELAGWDARVQSLRVGRLDADALDERSRAMLNLSDPADLIVPYPAGKRLF